MNSQCLHGDCLDVLKTMPDNSVDSIVTDPPYGLNFMGKKWDYDVPSEAIWVECLRVLKPGGHLLAFAGTRTQHRMAVRIEDAGFEIRDMIAWLYGSGFPKSHNGEWGGTALKPALEPITMARKPLTGTVASNWSEHGTGALNIDGCRVECGVAPVPFGKPSQAEGWRLNQRETDWQPNGSGRWPANLIHDGSDEVLAVFPDAASGGYPPAGGQRSKVSTYGNPTVRGEQKFTSSEGSSARFFYCAKASKEDRNEGCTGLPTKIGGMVSNTSGQHITRRDGGAPGPRANHHPTVKPTDLMRYLCRLVTPPGGIVLDPFMGSGSTGCAAALEGFQFVGIEREAEYVEIAQARITSAKAQGFQPSFEFAEAP